MDSRNNHRWDQRLQAVERSAALEIRGRITGMAGLTVEAVGFSVPIGAQCQIITRNARHISAQVIGFRHGVSILMPLADRPGITCGDTVLSVAMQATIPIGTHLLGRIIDGNGEPIDGKGPLLCHTRQIIDTEPLAPMQRARIDRPIGTGIRAFDALMTCGRGQRLGIFSGPGVGKSTLLGMIARHTAADVSVIALVGERGREVREFIDKDLGPEGLARSVVVVSTSEEPAPVRIRAGFAASAIAHYFRDQDKDVLLLMDSITRIAMAQRQIGLALGEPPATKGFTPSVFALLPQLVERCGKSQTGSITGFYTVLVEGDDLTEPISDAMRGLLDGHVWLSRDLANRGQYPAVDLTESISRVMVDIVKEQHLQDARDVVRLIAIYRDIEDLVNIGAYAPGSNPEYDLAVRAHGRINQFLQQGIHEEVSLEQALQDLESLMAGLKADLPAEAISANAELNPGATSAPGTNSLGLERMMAGL